MASQTTDTATLILLPSAPGNPISLASALTTYTSYSTSTFVSGGTTYKLSTGVPVIVTNSAELSTLSAAGAFQTATPSSEVAGGSIKTVTVSKGSAATSSSASNTSTPVGAGAGAGIGIAGVVLILALIVTIVWYSRRRRRQRTQHQIPKAKAEAEAKPQLEDTSAAWKDNIHAYKPELSAAQEVHELDAKTGRVLPPELRAGLYSNRHEMEGSSERV